MYYVSKRYKYRLLLADANEDGPLLKHHVHPVDLKQWKNDTESMLSCFRQVQSDRNTCAVQAKTPTLFVGSKKNDRGFHPPSDAVEIAFASSRSITSITSIIRITLLERRSTEGQMKGSYSCLAA